MYKMSFFLYFKALGSAKKYYFQDLFNDITECLFAM